MFNISQLYSIPQFLRGNFQEVSCVFLNGKLTNGLFLLQYGAENFIFYRQQKVDLNFSEKLLFSLQYDIENFIFTDSYHENFIFTPEYVFAERCCFLRFRLKETSENMTFPRMETYEN